MLPLLFGFAIFSTNAASFPKPSLGLSISMNPTDLYSSVTNVTSLGDDSPSGIDPKFGVEYKPRGVQLRPIACLMNVVNAMFSLAFQDFNANIQPGSIKMPYYPDVMIRSYATSSSPGTIPLRYVFWGVWSFALHVMETQNFEAMSLTLGFNEVIVGYLTIEKAVPQVLSLGGSDDDSRPETVSETSGTTLSLVSNTTTLSIPILNSTTTPSDNGEAILINHFGPAITFDDFFLPILAGLDYVARFPSDSPVASFTVRPTNTNTWIEFRASGTRPGTQAPVFKYQSVIRALASMARYMAVRGSFSGASILVQIDGVDVGKGWLRKGG